ncbi:GNAT family N-acetyltransferase [Butyrivibrio sp. AE3009]|uniref:GNAT family N-acetyltransferase n=1 Tax=Butyrivibrio sp. AE3009 TaxID=1280666 RepID=UPI0003B61CEB|nr:GNAT family N-acetyltransferase [Butyrivibrio sp. AE3009]
MNTVIYSQITEKNLEEYEPLILPMVVEELKQQGNFEENYLALAADDKDGAVGALVAELEDNGDISLLSVWTDEEHRREGIASGLLQKMTEVARALYDWEDSQYGDDILLKVMYCLEDEYREVFEEWLRRNDFTDFLVMRDKSQNRPEICGATAEIHFFRY